MASGLNTQKKPPTSLIQYDVGILQALEAHRRIWKKWSKLRTSVMSVVHVVVVGGFNKLWMMEVDARKQQKNSLCVL